MHHLEASLDMSPITYIQNRFRFGKDKEVAKRLALSPEEEVSETRKARA